MTSIGVERRIVGACLDSEAALRIALAELPPHPFRTHEAPWLEGVLYWATGRADRGAFDGIRNRDVLTAAMKASRWPAEWSSDQEREGWVELLPWSPQYIYDLSVFERLCRRRAEIIRALEDAVAATRRFIALSPSEDLQDALYAACLEAATNRRRARAKRTMDRRRQVAAA